ncbi:MAG: 2-C-methyl-D-erythritol 4-phosphate cytidylyltransferase [Lentisphaeria bacterium]|nr:2-C-methyl-D-erythritol 4-phosphate cytidylyltransferase [Lentisphaeria bacterium]
MNCAIIITGGGTGTRYGEKNKLLELLNGVPVFIHSVKNFAGLASKENYILTVNSRDRELFLRELEKYSLDDRITVVNGGASRVESVRNALDAVQLDSGRVAIHDAARPLAERALLEKLLDDERNVIAAQKVVDSIKLCDADGLITNEVDRTYLWRAETPQVFDIVEYRRAMEQAPADATDDAMIMRSAGYDVYVVKEEKENFKLTTASDLPKLEKYMN